LSPTSPTECAPLSLHDALPICRASAKTVQPLYAGHPRCGIARLGQHALRPAHPFAQVTPSQTTRRWQRHEADLPVSVVICDGDSRTRVAGRGTEISEGGMAVFAGVDLKPYDLMEIEFEAPSQARVIAVIRNRSGYCFGLEFLTPLSPDQENNSGPAAGEKKKLAAAVSSLVVSEFEKIRAEKGQAAAYAFLAE